MPPLNALFSLVPINERAQQVVLSERNKHRVGEDPDGRLVLYIGHFVSRSGNNTTLATIGRDEKSDICVENARVAKQQCSFELSSEAHFVMFFDRSHAMTSQVYGPVSHKFEQGRLRKVLVQPGFNDVIGFGGDNQDLIQFQIRWYQGREGIVQIARARRNVPIRQNPLQAETMVDSDAELTLPRITRVHGIGSGLTIRWYMLGHLGSGTYGDVFKVVNTDHGCLMAIKKMKQQGAPKERELLRSRWVREVKILSEANHPHIVEYIGAQGWERDTVEMFMALKEGTLRSLVESRPPISRLELGHFVFHHMLQAIDFLAMKGIVHRDIKPENILYTVRSGKCHFQLGDFGLSHPVAPLSSPQGTRFFIAPELFRRGALTHKADVWSLFITMLWTSGNAQFHSMCGGAAKGVERTCEIVSECILSEREFLGNIREMAEVNPQERASAAQMLVKCYQGEGLTTPRDHIPTLRELTPLD
ncbi:hypothetical protein E0Z10_g4320 [Xylaria hypoxylon]|uniref:mitogen-activated protein kinase n=1 Tax=Xylaria hypoxylon TaxID=37992 RepID=A0A4Z0YLC5_9PEZI|nr:hypothetical protein E0Z10_g4320 [Xylaria hypoxylon]